MKYALISLICAPTALVAGGVFDGADVVFLGELHDNPAHHLRQAEVVAEVEPTALVFEMLTQAQADLVTPDLVADEAALEAALGWNDSGWPDFSMYYPIFAEAPEAAYFGAAVPRDVARQAMETGMAAAFRGDADVYGLTAVLPEDQQAEREALQLAAHCDAMPEDMLPVMVDIQRLRDAELAYSAVQAFEAHGGPVVVITGNGHARKDWGAPVYLMAAAPDLRIASLGQGEEDVPPEGLFDVVETSPEVDRGDPCAAFR
ncbi:ChaN family lipoprotein [Marivita geojedonensis]|uniref:Lipoprotein n=1 Tax=Marivita geojedonensis TaxID=1123756 RepID=A0A1X4NP43_9RHOB|nr:ChaN family lipoprotein [Marivita geojedonensis]OSQ52523.1 lipoprotein [Marivita geojedonensis]PRY80705.1 putative iron-regulated protein [Marivita geojedonensis]